MSFSGPGRHLDAGSGRDVVYCHGCQHEWYQDQQQGLSCPNCRCEATEIVSPGNDPRPMDLASVFGQALEREGRQRQRHRHGADSDSDPDEDDIEHHLHHAPGGLLFSQRVYQAPGRSRSGRRPVDVNNDDAVFDHFTQMLGMMIPQFQLPPQLAQARNQRPQQPNDPLQWQQQQQFGGHFGHTTTVSRTNWPGGSASFTITRAPAHPDSDFNTAFGDIMQGNLRASPAETTGEGADGGGANNPNSSGGRPGGDLPGFGGAPATIQQLLGALFSRGHWGDMVHSEEEMDRIMTQLMDAHPMSNAAPPASQSAIDRLERKRLDAKMIGTDGKVECTICIDELHSGDEVAVLPCKHWFHGECVILWLKEHNTCPICRHPIEERPGPPSRHSSASASASAAGPLSAGGPLPVSASASSNPRPDVPPSWLAFPLSWPPGPPNLTPSPSPGIGSTGNNGGSSSSSNGGGPVPHPLDGTSNSYRRRDRILRSPSENQARLDAIRGTGLFSSPGHVGGDGGGSNGGSGGGDTRSTPPLGGYRRNSLSPPSLDTSSSSGQRRVVPELPREHSGHSSHRHSATQRTYSRNRREARSPSPPSSASRRRSLLAWGGEQDRGEGGSNGGEGGGDGNGAHRGGGGHSRFNWFRDRFPGSSGAGSSGRRS